MRLLIVRHGDPNYEIDSLTEVGWKEAEYLSDELVSIDTACGGFTDLYVSPHGRAKDTASFTLKKLGRQAEECEWLKEFAAECVRPDIGTLRGPVWDWLPADWTCIPEFYDPIKWKDVPVFAEHGVGAEYDRVCAHFDVLLEAHGYKRYDGAKGHYYEVIKANNDTLVFFCHFGLECVLLSHLMHCSPMVLWHHTAAAPSSITSVYTEERRSGIASFRISQFGDQSHLYAKGAAPSFSARFCECYSNKDERHD